jgi:hypothetical protein
MSRLVRPEFQSLIGEHARDAYMCHLRRRKLNLGKLGDNDLETLDADEIEGSVAIRAKKEL